MKKHLKNKEIRELSQEIENLYHKNIISKKDKVEIEDDRLIFINDELLFFKHEKTIIPTLRLLIKDNFLKKATVDMGAVKFVVKGADIMRPGITEIETIIQKGDFISIIDLNNKKPLAIGIALFSGIDIKNMDSGKVIKNIHFIGDSIWLY